MRTHLRRALALVAAGSVLTATAVIASAGTALADDSSGNPNAYSLTAEGDGMYYEVADSQLPAVTDTAVSPYSAQANVDSEGTSAAFAGLPYLGTTAETLPGTVNGLAGGNLPPIPPVPGYVSTNYPTSKSQTQKNGPYLLTATSSQYESHGNAGGGQSANAGSTQQQIYSTADTVANPDGSVLAKASAGVDGVDVGVINALNVSSTVSIALKGDGSAPTVTNTTNLGTFTVAGIKLGIDQSGFEVLGTPIPLPVSTALDAVNTALGGAGTKIEVVPAVTVTDPTTKQVTSITTAGLRITTVQDVPTQGPVTLQVTYGRATVSATDASFGGSSDSTSTDTTTPTTTTTDTTTPSAAPATDPATAPAAAPVASDGSGAATVDPGTTSLPDTSGLTTGSTDAGVPPPDVAASGPTVTSTHPSSLGFIKQASSAAPTGTSSRAIYLVLVLGGALILGGQQLFRGLGVRLLLRQP